MLVNQVGPYASYPMSKYLACLWIRHCMVYRLSRMEDEELRVPAYILADVCAAHHVMMERVLENCPEGSVVW